MKNFFKEKAWLFMLSFAFMASSTWTTVSAQDVKIEETKDKVTIIRTTSDENVKLFKEFWSPKSSKSRSSCRSYSFSFTSNDKDHKDKPQLGILLEGSEQGTVILKTFPNSAAEEAGLKAGDKILKVNGKASENIAGLQAIIASHQVGDALTIEYERDGSIHTSKATLKKTEKDHYLNHRTKFYHYKTHSKKRTNLSENPCEILEKIYGKPFLGVYLSRSHDDDGNGSRLTSVIEGTGAEKAKLQADDRIIKMNGTSISNTKEAIKFIKSKKPGDKVRILLVRDGQEKTIRATLGSYADSPQAKWKMAVLEEHCNRESPEEPVNNNDNVREEPQETTPATVEKAAVMEVFPNPTSDIVNIKFEGEKAPLTISLVSLDGKQMYTKTIDNFDGNYNGQLDLSKYPAGVYFVHLQQNEKQLSKQVVVE